MADASWADFSLREFRVTRLPGSSCPGVCNILSVCGIRSPNCITSATGVGSGDVKKAEIPASDLTFSLGKEKMHTHQLRALSGVC